MTRNKKECEFVGLLPSSPSDSIRTLLVSSKLSTHMYDQPMASRPHTPAMMYPTSPTLKKRRKNEKLCQRGWSREKAEDESTRTNQRLVVGEESKLTYGLLGRYS